ncbi:anaphase-promoting complex subunit 11 RING-H2 finger protein (macronuclear) [Tetrahymena thermophila SB210]|uniref:Anaphase-promoting complex subunit 11 RING-H2 finger protein n=1 Tax=Tetrahymena thermophila (strain SB210) TaxID=312017 RepID=I7MAW4_TETTS|nr:anaphase-promoting complex subunit 11 RING-H2 finger protein [Tetrahymena thermophila SB210]EAS06273.2 anaphase-promoting complex subunit 11 RING-H2 finger protein [Tetrahymena thermophila SB210]|eukprot:XP_001026518.2 anaphase-promoting complex subunit 11 RING-H2 finger protein [Tetrahymena thermophila SB210]
MKALHIYYLLAQILVFKIFIQCQSLSTDILSLDQVYQINQSQTIRNFKIDFKSNNQKQLSYLIISITISSIQYSASQFVACLNFNQSALDQPSYVISGNYSCQYSDNLATQQQLSQHLLILENNDTKIYSTFPFLTVFYQSQPSETTSYSQQLNFPVSYSVVIFYQNYYPCHSECNQHGLCDEQTGICSCYQQFYGSNCSIQPKSLTLDQIQELTLSPSLINYYMINLEIIIDKTQDSQASICITKNNGKAEIYIDFNININQLPLMQENNNKMILKNNYELNIQQICQQYQHQNTSNFSNNNMCLMILGIRQSISNNPSQITIQLCNQQQIIDQQAMPSKFNITQLIIIVIISLVCGLILLLFIYFFTKKYIRRRRAQMQQDSNNNQIQQIQNQAVLNRQFQQDQIQANKLTLYQYFMPLIQFENNNQLPRKQDIVQMNKQQSQEQQEMLQIQNIEFNVASPKGNIEKIELDQQKNENINNQGDTTLSETHTCSICLIELQKQHDLRLTICKHAFHSECLMAWIRKNENCPLCRQSFKIADIIDYIVVQKLNQNLKDQDQNEILKQKQKIQDIISDKKNDLNSFSQQDFINVFYFFLPLQSLKQNQFSLLKDEKNINKMTQILKLDSQQDIFYDATSKQIIKIFSFKYFLIIEITSESQSPVSLLTNQFNNKSFLQKYDKILKDEKSNQDDIKINKQNQSQNQQIQIK